uniref:HECT-type E3 ubiquitin transferase n=1 Tax=Phlebotomus papatasi TaxID=29031 RepID=A0A1B0DFM2_PHLPP
SVSVLYNFLRHILSPELTRSSKILLLPYIVTCKRFPYMKFLTYLSSLSSSEESNQLFGSSLLYSLLYIDRHYLDLVKNDETKSHYLKSLSQILNCSVRHFAEKRLEGQMESQSDSDDEENISVAMTEVTVEEDALRESVKILGDSRHLNKIAEFVDTLVDDHEAISATCHICNSLMVYGRLSSTGSSHLLLRILAERSKFIRGIWASVELLSRNLSSSFTSAIVRCADTSVPLLTTFCTLLSQKISTLHDEEFIAGHELNSSMPFNIGQIIEITLKNNYKPIIDPSGQNISETTMELERDTKWRHIFKVCVTLLRQIYNRDLRLSFCPPNHWEIPSFNLVMDKSANIFYLQHSVQDDLISLSAPAAESTSDQMPAMTDNGGIPMTAKQIRSIKILKEIPFTISFNSRVVMFQELLSVDKIRAQREPHRFFVEPLVHITVRRSHLYEDSFNKLSYEN